MDNLRNNAIADALCHVLSLIKGPCTHTNCTDPFCKFLSEQPNILMRTIVNDFFSQNPNVHLLAIPCSKGHPITMMLARALQIPHIRIQLALPRGCLFTCEPGKASLSFLPLEDGLVTIFDEVRLATWFPLPSFDECENR